MSEQSTRSRFPQRSHVNLKALRLAAHISQDELGFVTGIAQSRISRAERGLLWLNDIEAATVAKALGVKIGDLDEVPVAVEG